MWMKNRMKVKSQVFRVVMIMGLILFGAACATTAQEQGPSQDALIEEGPDEGEVDVETWSEDREALEERYLQTLQIVLDTDDPREYTRMLGEVQRESLLVSRELESYFEGSDGDRDVFGWMMVRKGRLVVNLACLQLNFPVPENTPPERRETFEESLVVRAESMRSAARRDLSFAMEEGSEPWVSIAEEWARDLDDESLSVYELCAEHFEAIQEDY